MKKSSLVSKQMADEHFHSPLYRPNEHPAAHRCQTDVSRCAQCLKRAPLRSTTIAQSARFAPFASGLRCGTTIRESLRIFLTCPPSSWRVLHSPFLRLSCSAQNYTILFLSGTRSAALEPGDTYSLKNYTTGSVA